MHFNIRIRAIIGITKCLLVLQVVLAVKQSERETSIRLGYFPLKAGIIVVTEGDKDVLYGFKAPLYRALVYYVRRRNYTLRFVECEEREYGMRDSVGNYSGLIGQLQRNEADLTVAFTLMSIDVPLKMGTAYVSDRMKILSVRPTHKQHRIGYMQQMFIDISNFWLFYFACITIPVLSTGLLSESKSKLQKLAICLALFTQLAMFDCPSSIRSKPLQPSISASTQIGIEFFDLYLKNFLGTTLSVEDAFYIDSFADILRCPYLRLVGLSTSCIAESMRSSSSKRTQAIWEQMKVNCGGVLEIDPNELALNWNTYVSDSSVIVAEEIILAATSKAFCDYQNPTMVHMSRSVVMEQTRGMHYSPYITQAKETILGFFFTQFYQAGFFTSAAFNLADKATSGEQKWRCLNEVEEPDVQLIVELEDYCDVWFTFIALVGLACVLQFYAIL